MQTRAEAQQIPIVNKDTYNFTAEMKISTFKFSIIIEKFERDKIKFKRAK